MSEASQVFVQTFPHKGTPSLCLLEKRKRGAQVEVHFEFQKTKFYWNSSSHTFLPSSFPTYLPFQFYKKAKGICSQTKPNKGVGGEGEGEGEEGVKEEMEEEYSREKWGGNEMVVPQPTFKELLVEQALAPFFLFQMLCVVLWMLDEYWYYSLLTFFMLLSFEVLLVNKRLSNLKVLRGMLSPPLPLRVWRDGAWKLLPPNQLVVGDLCLLQPPHKPKQKERGGECVMPCDMLLLRGSCVMNEAMLTGESTPLRKESVEGRRGEEKLELKRDQVHLLFSGTKLLLSSPPPLKESGKGGVGAGCVGYVLRTGFASSQGKLVKKILYNTQHFSANNLESLLFILFLLFFAIVASVYVWVEGRRRERGRYKLLLNCVMIVTSVVPPELPIQLSLAVNNSLLLLQKLGVFCTEPFRIPFAGKVDACCFDKTGTLTSELLSFEGLLCLPSKGGEEERVERGKEIGVEAQKVIGGCHSLVLLDSSLQGDPMEVASMEGIEWSTNGECSFSKSRKTSVTVLQRFHFTSFEKRMTTIVKASTGGKGEEGMVCMKGAAEVVYTFLKEKPPLYFPTIEKWSRRGYRILSLAYKPFPLPPPSSPSSLGLVERSQVERELLFLGFLLFECPLKSPSFPAISQLAHSNHFLVILTGDFHLTSLHVAHLLHLLHPNKPLFLLHPPSSSPSKEGGEEEEKGVWVWKRVRKEEEKEGEGESQVECEGGSKKEWERIGEGELCVSGEGVEHLEKTGKLGVYLNKIRVYARCSPSNKETVVREMKKKGWVTLMCGDGTNDVGALKQAHVGIALLNTPDSPDSLVPSSSPPPSLSSSSTSAPGTISQLHTTTQTKKMTTEANTSPSPLNSSIPKSQKLQELKAKKGKSSATEPKQKKETEKILKKWEEISEEDGPKVVELGDASIAAPFTVKKNHILPVIDIIRQGRCTLVTTLQMYKILALNCLITAYSLSVLYFEGIKFGDT